MTTIVPSSRWSSGKDDLGLHIAHANHRIYWDEASDSFHGYTDGMLVAVVSTKPRAASARANLAKALQMPNQSDWPLNIKSATQMRR